MICDGQLELFDFNDNATVDFLEVLVSLSASYGDVHKYLSLALCVFGSAANVVHLVVLTRPAMRNNAVNQLLGYIALCDIIIMVFYVVLIIRFGFGVDPSDPPPGFELTWIYFLLAHVILSIALHTNTLYICVVMAYIRCKSINGCPCSWNHRRTARPLFLAISFCILILCVPTFLLHSIEEISERPGGRHLYTTGLTQFTYFSTCSFFKFNLWLTAIMFKVLPCSLLLVLTTTLLWKLRRNKRRRDLLIYGKSIASGRSSMIGDRTTKTLLVLLTIFIITEFPQGIMAFLNGLFPNDIHHFVYLTLGEVLDLLSLINCNTCFIVYPLVHILTVPKYAEELCKGYVVTMERSTAYGSWANHACDNTF